jgi:endonuclease YncB( thermonuclease family)
MKKLFVLVALPLAFAVSAGERCTAADGGSLRCGRELVRVDGIRAPRLNEPGGAQARKRLQERLGYGELVIQRYGRDKYGYTLGRVYVGGKRISQLDVTPRGK